MSKVTFDYSKAASFISEEEVGYMSKLVDNAKKELLDKNGAGNDFLGWLDLPVDYDKEEFARIQKAAAKIQSDSEVLVVIGIGGSYLGARAAIEFLRHGSIIMFLRMFVRLLRFIMQETASAEATYRDCLM